MSRRLASISGALLLLLSLSVASVGAEENRAPSDSPFGPVLELLREKRIISAEEAKALALRGGSRQELSSLVELLKGKGIISAEEAAKVALPAAPPALDAVGEKVLPASQDAKFIAQLRERWVKNKNRGRDFDEWFAGMTDPEEILSRIRVMGALSAAESDELERLYRDHYLSGAIAQVMEQKETDYLERLRKSVDWELDEKIKEKTKNEWNQRVRVGGDVRVRYEQDFFANQNGDFLNPASTTQILNSKIDREMLKLRARLNVDAKVADDFRAVIGLATDTNRASGSPVSTNATLGDSFNKKALALDLAYLKWSPDPSFALWAGRFPNPWSSTDLVWDPDVNFDGVALQYAPRLNERWGLSFTTGIFPVQEVELSQHDKWLFGSQLGAQYLSSNAVSAKFAVAYYDYMNTVGVRNDPTQPGLTDWSAPAFQQKGNTLFDIDPGNSIKTAYASAFRELNLTGSLDLGDWHPVHVVLSADYVNNLGFNHAAVNALAGSVVKKETEGFQVGLSVGYPVVQALGEWKGLFSYKYLESDAVMDAFTDSDFHLGGTNARGWIAGADLGLAKDVWLSTRWFSANEISGAPFAIDVFHFNINARF
jgi:hypothetical protein